MANQEKNYTSIEAEQILEQATTLLNQRNFTDASKLYDHAILIFDQIVNHDGKLEFEGRLGKAYALKASALQGSRIT